MRAVQRTEHLTAIIEREDDGYVALCPELDIASQGQSVEGPPATCGKLSLFSLKLPAHQS